MSTLPSVTERYDHALRYARHSHLPPGTPVPQPTIVWPPENIALLQHYQAWLLSSGASPDVVKVIYLPMAGHVLGLTLKPHPRLDLDTDLNRALDYVNAKHLSRDWTKVCRNALAKFRLFLRQQRGHSDLSLSARSLDSTPYCANLPDWLVAALSHYQHLMQRHWRPGHLDKQVLSFWNSHTKLWRWLFEHYPVTDISDIKRQYILDYFDHCLAKKYAISTINNHLRCFQATLRYLQEQDYLVPQVLLRLPGLKEPDRLPRFLTDEQVRKVRDDLEARVAQARSLVQQRDALLDRAVFYLLWQGGLRLGEVEDLCLEDLDLAGRKVSVRQGKGLKDRTVYLTDRAVVVLQAYLDRRGMGGSDHVFLYHHRALRKDLIHARLQAAGKRTGVNVTAHRLRHTCATQLLNAGCRVTSIQKLLGHRRLNSTMIYARVHDQTVAGDYYAAMDQIEKGLDLVLAEPTHGTGRMSEEERTHLLELISRLAEPHLDLDLRLNLVAQMRRLLSGETPEIGPPETRPGNELCVIIGQPVPLDAVAPVW
jgi:site-specific recombinase XerD